MVWGRADRPRVNRSADRQMLRLGLTMCANSFTRVATNPAPMLQITLRCFTGSVLAAEASAPKCTEWPDGNASIRLPENGTLRQCP
jgi:hypothetical protein